MFQLWYENYGHAPRASAVAGGYPQKLVKGIAV